MPFKEISKINIMSAAKLMAAVYGALGLIGGLLVFLIAILSIAVGGGYGTSVIFALFMGIFLLIIYPIIGIVGGFIGGAVFAFIYNLAAGRFGGIKIELK